MLCENNRATSEPHRHMGRMSNHEISTPMPATATAPRAKADALAQIRIARIAHAQIGGCCKRANCAQIGGSCNALNGLTVRLPALIHGYPQSLSVASLSRGPGPCDAQTACMMGLSHDGRDCVLSVTRANNAVRRSNARRRTLNAFASARCASALSRRSRAKARARCFALELSLIHI